MATFKLSASLKGHEDDVRCVAFPNSKTVLSASRDSTVRVWKQLSLSPPTYDCRLSSHGSAFVNTVASLPASSQYPDGLIISGGKDTIIEVRQPHKAPQDNADALLLGHSSNVCALDVEKDGTFIVSGSWDTEARIWKVGQWDAPTAVLKGHDGSVWAVLAYDKQTIITGCADRLIRIFDTSGKLLKSIRGSSDVVRALCKIPADHVSNAHFASAGNDAVIRLWTLEGRQVAQLYGHENFIYSLAVLPGGELVSSSEDRTARIWKGDQCIQTITHPAISVWSVAASQDSGDIVTGASDRIVRVFTRSNERKGDDQTLREFEESVKSSSIPQQQVGNINKENIPGPEFLQQKSGTKEGQVQMIKEANGAISAYQWSIATQEWINIGTVVDAVGSSGKKITHQGQDYDYVFDVDIEDGKPPLKLPYNISQNPYEAARKFVEDNKLPITYLDQVANFIVSNTQGATLGQSSNSATAPPGSDPWGTESRYRPGEVGAPNPPPAPESRPKILPQTQYLSIITANLRTIEKKVKELNDQLLEQGRKDVSLSPSDLSVLSATLKQLERAQSSAQPDASNPALNEGIAIVIKMVTDWPTDKRLPGLDILRLLAAASPSTVSYTSSGEHTVVDVLGSSGVFSPDSPPNNTMLAIRTLANFCNTEAGRLIVDGTFEQIHSFVQPFIKSYTSSQNRNLTIAITTLYINFAVLLIESAGRSEGLTANADRALTLLDDLTRLISSVVDSEALYRALIAAGTLLSLGQDFRSAAREVFEIESALSKAQKVGVEPRIKAAIAEIRDLLA